MKAGRNSGVGGKGFPEWSLERERSFPWGHQHYEPGLWQSEGLGFAVSLGRGPWAGTGLLAARHASRRHGYALFCGAVLQRLPSRGRRCKGSPLASVQRSCSHPAGPRGSQWPKCVGSVKAPAGQSTGRGRCCPGKAIGTAGHPMARGIERLGLAAKKGTRGKH